MLMKKGILLIFTLLNAFALLASEPYFCTRAGVKFHYERRQVGSGKLTQTTLFEITSFASSQGGHQVSYAVTLKKANGKEMFGGRAVQTALISSNGDASLNFGETVKGFVGNMFPRVKITVTESTAVLPARMQPGDTLPETHCTMKVSGVPVYFHVTDRKVLRRETITTPAGTFDCLVVRERKEEDAPFHHLDNWLDNYYAVGIGYVRHDLYDKNMRLLESEVLVRIEEPVAGDNRH